MPHARAWGQRGWTEEGQESVTGSVCQEGNARSGSPDPVRPPVSGQGEGAMVGPVGLGTGWWPVSGLGGFGRWLCPGKGRRLCGTPSPAGIPRHRPAMLQSRLSLAAAQAGRAPWVSAIPPSHLPGPPFPSLSLSPAPNARFSPCRSPSVHLLLDKSTSCPKSPKFSLFLLQTCL